MKITDRKKLQDYINEFRKSFDFDAYHTQRVQEGDVPEVQRVGLTKDQVVEAFIFDCSEDDSFAIRLKKFVDKYYPRGDESYDIVGFDTGD